MPTRPTNSNTRNLVLVAALGYFVDIYDLVLFSIVRVKSLVSIGVPADELLSKGILLINSQMLGMLVGGILWGILGDKKGRVSVLFASIFLYSLANILNAFVDSVTQYTIIRFIAGVGLAGELGVGITLVTESMKKENRGYGTMIVAAVGLMGAVAAALVAERASWQMAYIIGGVLGLGLLGLRIGVFDSGLFQNIKEQAIKRGNFLALFTKTSTFKKYLACIVLGLPVWFAIGIPVTFSPEFGKSLGLAEPLSAGTAILYAYIGLALGDVATGLLSQVLKSRKKVLLLFLALSVIACAVMFYSNISAAAQWYWGCLALGFSAGYWALFVTVAAEHFGTNIRATVSTTVPNFVRGAVVPITLGFSALKQAMGMLNAAATIAFLCILLASWAAIYLPETFGKDLDYVEHE